MSSHLTVNQTHELLESLKGIVRDFAANEERLNRDWQAKTEVAQRRFRQEMEEQEAQAAQQIQERETALETARRRLTTKFEQRKARITKAHKSSQRQTARRVDDHEGGRKYQVQRGLLDTQRVRTEGLAQNDATLAEFDRQLAESQEAFSQLEQAAAGAFRGYRRFRRLLTASAAAASPNPAADEYPLLQELRESQSRIARDLTRFRKYLLPQIFRFVPLWLWLVLLLGVGGGLGPALEHFQIHTVSRPLIVAGAGAGLVLVLAGYFFGRRQAGPLAVAIGRALVSARQWHAAAAEKGHARHACEIERIETGAKERKGMLERNWQEALTEAGTYREVLPQQLDEKGRRITAKHEVGYRDKRAQIERTHLTTLARLKQEAETRRGELTAAQQARMAKFNADYQAHWQKLEAEWKRLMEPIQNAMQSANTAAQLEFPAWEPAFSRNWSPPAAFKNAVKFARLEVDVKKFAEAVPQDPRLPVPAVVSLPLWLTYPQQGSILFETSKGENEEVIAALNNILFRLLATTPAGKLSFTLIDPVKLGQSFATIMHLADYEDNLLNGRIWTQANQIEERLADLNEHMEKVIQMYLRNEYETIAEYNREAGNIAEKYHFVVVADFPAGFSETAVRRLLRIAASGARCGVYTLIHWDHRHTTPPDFFPEELRKSSVCLNVSGHSFVLSHPLVAGAKVLLDAPPDAEFTTEFLRRVGEASRGSNRVEVPFPQVAPAPNQVWTLDTTEELRVPIGRSGATKLQYLALGRGTRQHALIAGKTGSGKSTLFHVIITNLALWAGPEQVEFYLVDFKKGVEFKAYATRRLPHARVVAIESDREFGLSVLQRVDEELKRRGDLFRALGVQDLAGYKKAGGTAPLPRCLLMIDEFQEFFVEDDRISQAANLLLDRIVRQGRAFGIHVLLGSQTLGGAYTLARTTIGQMVVRVALQCNEADAYLIMDENNAAPRLLTRPGEGIYNDMAGAAEGNSPFQTVWLSDEERAACLEQLRARADQKAAAYPGPIVFEGNAPADVRENRLLRSLLEAPSLEPKSPARFWLGAPNSIKGPTEAVFPKRSGSNLLVVGPRDEAVLTMLSLGLITLSTQFPRDAVRFVLFESTAPDSPERAYLQRVVERIPHEVLPAKAGDLNEIMNQLATDLQQRAEDERAAARTTFLFLHGLQNFKKLRQDDDFSFASDDSGSNAAAQLQKLISEGPSHGLHVIATLDTYNNVNRFLGRKALSEFEMRVLFQMSSNDSASLCDDPKASTLGLHRALFYNEQEGYLETFRPYALPDGAWIEEAGRQLARSIAR